MGLDMYLTGRKVLFSKFMETPIVEDDFPVVTIEVELGYWRKHPDLHGYIVAQFANGEDNQKPIELNADDITNIIEAIRNLKLPKTEGFFFGASNTSEEQQAKDIKVFQKALEWLKSGGKLPEPKKTEIGAVLENVGLTVYEVGFDEDSPPAMDIRSVIYRGDW